MTSSSSPPPSASSSASSHALPLGKKRLFQQTVRQTLRDLTAQQGLSRDAAIRALLQALTTNEDDDESTTNSASACHVAEPPYEQVR